MSKFVLDASAVLTMLKNEPGTDQVKAALPSSTISAVNFSEVIAKMTDYGLSPTDAAATLQPLPFAVVPFDRDRALAAGQLRPLTKAAEISLGDRACLALAQELGIPVLTSDRAWSQLNIGVRIVQIR